MDYVPIRTATIRASTNLLFDVYIKISEKYIHYIKAGDDIPIERLSKLKKNKVRQLFIQGDHEPHYQDYLDGGLEEAKNNVMMSADEKADMVSNYSGQAADEIMKNPEEEKSYKKAQKAAQGIVDIIAKNDDVLKAIIQRTSVSMDDGVSEVIVKHSVNVASFATRLGEILGFSDEVLSELGIAGLYHDVGLTKLPPKITELIKTDEEQIESADFEMYRKHPTISSDLLASKDFAKKAVIDFILRHEEKKSGKGFPNGTKKISAEQEVFNICCFFSKRLVGIGMPAADIISLIDGKEKGNYDPQIVSRFKGFLEDEGIV
jgi:HD-GYP domain-containing protein (c-di-GMP phosphodiesterase class II)